MKGAMLFSKQIHTISKLIPLLALSLSACKMQVTEKTATTAAIVAATPVPTYDCTYYSEFNSMTLCQAGTEANCTSQWRTFPNGGISQCYAPVAGWESCLVNPTPAWIYTLWNVQAIDVTNNYTVTRSVVGCSDSVCVCSDPQDLSETVSYADVTGGICPIIDLPNTACTYIFPGGSLTGSILWSISSVGAPLPAITNGGTSPNLNPVFSMVGGTPGATVNIYDTSSCSSPLNALPWTLSGTGTMTGGTIPAVSGSGAKQFWYKITSPSGTSSCLNTNVWYNVAGAPVLVGPDDSKFPSAQLIAGSGSTVTFDVNEATNGDLDMSYSCVYDRKWNYSGSPTALCNTMPDTGGTGVATFNTSTGVLSWSPASTEFGVYEVCVTGTNVAGSAQICYSIQVSPNFETASLRYYFDAQFAQSAHGTQGDNCNWESQWKDLNEYLGTITYANLNNFSSLTCAGVPSSGWTGSVGITTPSTAVNRSPFALAFDGVNDGVDFGTITSGFNAVAMDFWMKPSDVANAATKIILSNGTGSATGARGLTFAQVNQGTAGTKLQLSLGSVGSSVNVTSNAILHNENWYHVVGAWEYVAAATYRLRLYINGVYDNQSATYTTGAGYSYSTVTANLKMGNVNNNPTDTWKGAIANFKIYNPSAGVPLVSTISSTNYAVEKARFIVGFPATLTGLKVWHKADAVYNVSDDDYLNTWKNLTNYASIDSAQVTNAFAPHYRDNATDNMNGYPVMRFNGTNQYYNFAAGVGPTPNPSPTPITHYTASPPGGTQTEANYSIFIVAKVKNTVANTTCVLGSGSGWYSSYMQLCFDRSANNIYSVYAGSSWRPLFVSWSTYYNWITAYQNVTTAAASFASYNTPLLISKIQSGSTGMSETIYLNGTAQAAATSCNTTTPPMAGTSCPDGFSGNNLPNFIGRADSGGGYFDGDIAEVLIFDRTLTAGERATVDTYLKDKYAIP